MTRGKEYVGPSLATLALASREKPAKVCIVERHDGYIKGIIAWVERVNQGGERALDTL